MPPPTYYLGLLKSVYNAAYGCHSPSPTRKLKINKRVGRIHHTNIDTILHTQLIKCDMVRNGNLEGNYLLDRRNNTIQFDLTQSSKTSSPPPPPPATMYRPKTQQPRNFQQDDGPKQSTFVPTRHCKALEKSNFQSFLSQKEAAFVMFYDPECHHCTQTKPHMQKVAKDLNHRTRGFATVDCSTETDLCDAEKITQFPSFKLYVGGKYLNSYKGNVDCYQMIKFVENAPKVPDNEGHGWPKKHTPMNDRDRFDHYASNN